MTAIAAGAEFGASGVPEKWVSIDAAAPVLAATMLTYLAQIAVSMRPSTVTAVETDLRIFAGFLIEHDQALTCVADVERSHVEAFKIWQRTQPGQTGKPFKASSFRRRMSMLKMFFIRITEWEWDDAPPRVPIFFGDVPKRDESLPKFLDDGDYTKFMRALADEPALFRGSLLRCWPGPGCALVSSANSRPTRSTSWATNHGSGSRSGNFTTTGSSRCTPTSSS